MMGDGQGEWGRALSKAKKMVSGMSLEEKVHLTSGGTLGNGCHGAVAAMDHLDFPGLCLCDAGQGLRASDFVSSFPSGLHVGASWNQDLARKRASAMGAEFKKKGVNILLGPVAGPLGRVVLGGRNWEGFGSDPYLSGVFVYESVIGIQDEGVMATTKHFIGNEQETNRMPNGEAEAVSSNIDDRTMHELYMWPFQDAMKAGTGVIMCSYQRVNNSYGCANSKVLNGLLKTELGFQGFVVSDWDAQHAGVATALAGMDMTMPNPKDFWGDRLIEAVRNGSVPQQRVDDMAHRILTPWFRWNQDSEFKNPGKGMPASLDEPHKIIDARDPDARDILVDGAIQGHVLVKNTKNTLPLNRPKMLSIYGYSAKSPDIFAPVRGGEEAKFKWEFGGLAVSAEEVFSGFSMKDYPRFSATGLNGTMLNGGGSGSTTPSFFLSPLEALKMKAATNGTAIFHDFESPRPRVNAASDACIVFGNAWASESYDRPAIRDDYTDGLIKSVADQCNKTIVVFHNAGTRLVDQFVNHPNVTAILFAHLPGQETGPALVSLLYGEANPSGKLPYTVAKNESDYGSLLKPSLPEGEHAKFPQSAFSEGPYIDYAHFEREGIEPRYEFGFGLSYTSFSIDKMGVDMVDGSQTGEWPTGPIMQGGQRDLWDPLVNVTVTVTNTGDVAGAEVAQLYLTTPGEKVKRLRGFSRHFLQPGKSAQAEFALTRRDLSVWSTEAQKWHLQRGEYTVQVGSSSKSLPLKDAFKMD